MTASIILALIGIIFGGASLGLSGGLAGGVMGFLVGQVMHLSKRLKTLERDVFYLQKQLAQPSTTVEPTRAAANTATPVSAASVTTKESRIPLAARIQSLDLAATSVATTAPVNPHLEIKPADQSLSSSTVDDPVLSRPAAANESTQPTVVNVTVTQVDPWHDSRARHAQSVQPHAIDKFFNAVGRFFTEGNPIVRIGMVVMFFGLSFLVKYASSEGLFPIELRLAAVAAVAIVLMLLGWKTRTKEGGYGLVLQGGGIAALYLTVFAATKIYPLLPPGFAFVLMFIIVLFGAAMAVLQNAQVLALIATAGGFLAPILTSEGSGNHIALFSFYLLLNIGVLAIAWFRTWRTLNWVGFIFTFVITSTWGVLRYEPDLYASTQPFLIAFFALYLIVSILFSLKQPPKLTGLVDGSLVFGLPIVAFGLQTALLKHTEYGLAISAVGLSAIYIGLAGFLWSKYQQSHRVLIESFIALGVTFATLAIPLALDADWTSATWALEATGLIWVGLRQQRLLSRVAGYLLYMAAAVSLLISGGIAAGPTPIVSGDFIGLFILAVSALCIAYTLNCYTGNIRRGESLMELIAMMVGWVWWLIAGFIELNAHLAESHHFAAMILFITLSTLAMLLLSRQLNWQQLTRTGFWLLPLAVLWISGHFGDALFDNGDLHPSQGFGLLSLVAFALVQYRFLWRQRENNNQTLVSAYHVLSAWFILGLVFWEASWWQGHNAWQGTGAVILWFTCFALPLILLMVLTRKNLWPFAQYEVDYKNLIPAPLMFLLLLWFIETCSYSGITTQHYLPLLNPLDLAQLGAVLLVGYAIKRKFVKLAQVTPEMRYGMLGLAGFVWINVVLLRAIHHYTDVNYSNFALWNSVVVQMALSILWTLCALGVMNLSRRKQARNLWMIGAGLLALVVLKLFTKDLTGSGTLARIVSFMVVGGLMLLIGYLSPIPAKNPSPKLKKETAQ